MLAKDLVTFNSRVSGSLLLGVLLLNLARAFLSTRINSSVAILAVSSYTLFLIVSVFFINFSNAL